MWMMGVPSVEQRGRMLPTYFLNAFIVKCFGYIWKASFCKYLGIKVYFSEKYVFFYFNREILPPNVIFIVNLCLILGNHHKH